MDEAWEIAKATVYCSSCDSVLDTRFDACPRTEMTGMPLPARGCPRLRNQTKALRRMSGRRV